MPRPVNKEELVKASEEQFEKLWQMIDTMPESTRTAVFDFGDYTKLKEAHWKRDQNVRDVLVHLYEWHQLFIKWVTLNKQGEKKVFLPEEYNWRTYGDMNMEFWKKHQNTSYDEAKKLLLESHAQVMKIITEMSNDELFSKDPFGMKGSPIGSYCTSNTSSHYEWAMKKLKKHRLTYKGVTL